MDRETVNDPSCSACRIASGAEVPPGGVVHREGGLLLHALHGPSPLPGWLVLTSEHHVRAWPDLDPAALAALGPLAARVMRAQREVLGAEHVYAFAVGDVVRHFHLHLVPRYAGTPARLRGRGAFQASPAEALEAEVLAAAAARVATAIASR
jgi:diadenosine tetraphosphate (Ap4A) HIT family hydrolase